MAAGSGIDELRRHPDLVAAWLDAAFEHIVDAEIVADASHIGGLASVNLGRIPRDDEQILRVRQVRDDILGDAISKPVPLGVAADIGEGQDRDGCLLGQ
jgi:hypothetical protein